MEYSIHRRIILALLCTVLHLFKNVRSFYVVQIHLLEYQRDPEPKCDTVGWIGNECDVYVEVCLWAPGVKQLCKKDAGANVQNSHGFIFDDHHLPSMYPLQLSNGTTFNALIRAFDQNSFIADRELGVTRFMYGGPPVERKNVTTIPDSHHLRVTFEFSYTCYPDTKKNMYCNNNTEVLCIPNNNETCLKNGTKVCKPHFFGKMCSTYCKASGNQLCDSEGKLCCKLGFKGDLCATQTDGCLRNPCKNEGTCVDGVNISTCLCTPCFYGTLCEFNINVSSCDAHGLSFEHTTANNNKLAETNPVQSKESTSFSSKHDISNMSTRKWAFATSLSPATGIEETTNAGGKTTFITATSNVHGKHPQSQTTSDHVTKDRQSVHFNSTIPDGDLIYSSREETTRLMHIFKTSSLAQTIFSTKNTPKGKIYSYSMLIKGNIDSKVQQLKTKINGFYNDVGVIVQVSAQRTYGFHNEPLTDVTFKIICGACVLSQVEEIIDISVATMKLQQYNFSDP